MVHLKTVFATWEHITWVEALLLLECTLRRVSEPNSIQTTLVLSSPRALVLLQFFPSLALFASCSGPSMAYLHVTYVCRIHGAYIVNALFIATLIDSICVGKLVTCVGHGRSGGI